MIGKLFLAVILVTSLVCGQNNTQNNDQNNNQNNTQNNTQNRNQTVPFTCSTANGTAPDSTDVTCKRFWSCQDFNISLNTCSDGEAYSWYSGACVNESQVPCQDQNEAFNETIANQTANAGRQKRSATSYDLPQFIVTSNSTTNSSSRVEPGQLEPIRVTLGEETCKHIGNNILAAERVTNNALHLFTHCVFHRCDIEPVQFVCP